MHISEIEDFIKSFKETENRLGDILAKDADYIAQKDLPSRDKATSPNDIISGANLRVRIDRKYGGQAIDQARTELNKALLQFEEALRLSETSEKSADTPIQNTKTVAGKVDEESIATDAPSVEDILRVNDTGFDSWSSQKAPEFLAVRDKVSASDACEIDDLDNTLNFPKSGNAVKVGGAIAAAMIGLVVMIATGTAYPEAAIAEKLFFK